MAEQASWADYNEKNPFGKGATVVGGDNIAFSKARRDAIRAVMNGSADASQYALVHEADAVIREALSRKE